MAGTLMIPAPAGVDAESEHMGAALTIFWRVADHSYSAVGASSGGEGIGLGLPSVMAAVVDCRSWTAYRGK
jgi:hypothetical protein